MNAASLIPDSRPDQVVSGSLVLGAGALVAALAEFWGANPGYADRFLILIGAGYALVRLLAGWSQAPIQPRPLFGVPLVVVGVIGFPVGYFLLTQIGPRTLLLWWLMLALVAIAAGAILTQHGFRRLGILIFPLLFPLFALPIPLRVLGPLQNALQDLTTSLAYVSLSSLGLAVSREEFVLSLPGGKLRVEEACSGVRSLTALTALAAFVAFLRGFSWVRGLVLVGLSVPIVAMVNVIRVILTGLIQENIGPEYIQGNWHEALGFAMVILGLVLILLLASVLGSRTTPTSSPNESPRIAPRLHSRWGWVVAGLVLLGLGLTVCGVGMGQASVDEVVAAAPIDEIPPALGNWTGEDRPVPPVIHDQLAPDKAVYRVYTNNFGVQASVWVFYWGTGAAIKGYHHPDLCWGNRGFVAHEQWIEPIPTGLGSQVPVTAREFRQGRSRQLILYWTQEGSRVWSAEDERAAASDTLSVWQGQRWVGDLLGLRSAPPGARLTVVVAVSGAGTSTRQATRELTTLLTAEVYRTCPWARPLPEEQPAMPSN